MQPHAILAQCSSSSTTAFLLGANRVANMRATPRAAPSARVLNYTGHFAGSRVTASRSLFLINVKCSCETEAWTERERENGRVGGRDRSSGDLRRRFSWSSRNVGSNTSSRAGKARSPPIRKPYQLPSCSFARSLPRSTLDALLPFSCLSTIAPGRFAPPIEVCSSCLRWDSLIVPSCRALFRDTGFDDTGSDRFRGCA